MNYWPLLMLPAFAVGAWIIWKSTPSKRNVNKSPPRDPRDWRDWRI